MLEKQLLIQPAWIFVEKKQRITKGPNNVHFAKLAFNFKTKQTKKELVLLCVLSGSDGSRFVVVFVVVSSGAVGEGGHHVPSTLSHRPAVLLRRALKPALSPGGVRVEGEHLLQVFEHVVKHPVAEAPRLKAPAVAVHGLAVRLEVAVEVAFLVGLVLGVEVVLMLLLLIERVVVFEEVVEVEVEGLEVLPEVVVVFALSSSCVALT